MPKTQKDEWLLADASVFQQWLLNRQEEIVGYVGSKERCPLACWHAERTDMEYSIGRNYYGREGKSAPLPEWAWLFVQVLEVEEEGAILGKDALGILESILESLQEPAKKRRD